MSLERDTPGLSEIPQSAELHYITGLLVVVCALVVRKFIALHYAS